MAKRRASKTPAKKRLPRLADALAQQQAPIWPPEAPAGDVRQQAPIWPPIWPPEAPAGNVRQQAPIWPPEAPAGNVLPHERGPRWHGLPGGHSASVVVLPDPDAVWAPGCNPKGLVTQDCRLHRERSQKLGGVLEFIWSVQEAPLGRTRKSRRPQMRVQRNGNHAQGSLSPLGTFRERDFRVLARPWTDEYLFFDLRATTDSSTPLGSTPLGFGHLLVAPFRRTYEALERASLLLARSLTPEQLRDLWLMHGFVVTAPSGRRYRIWYNRAHNIDELDAAGSVVTTWCAAPSRRQVLWMPREDVLLAQKLEIESDEEGFRRLANPHPPAHRDFSMLVAEARQPRHEELAWRGFVQRVQDHERLQPEAVRVTNPNVAAADGATTVGNQSVAWALTMG